MTRIEPSEKLAPFIRGRVAKSDNELTAILSDPASQLGLPPPDFATAGRMNAAGVSVFYCAYDRDICCKECRPPVGSHMVYGYFELLRPLNVLNLSKLASLSLPEDSIFSPDYSQRGERAGFLRQLDWEISQPVMPGGEGVGYLHTQAVADYLAHRLGLDGVLYRSTQSGASRNALKPPQNLVLFHHASRAERLDTTNWEIEVDLGWWDEEQQDGDDGISIHASEKEHPSKPEAERDPIADWFVMSADQEVVDERPITLRILPAQVEVERVQAASYEREKRYVKQTRTTWAERGAQEASGQAF